MLKLLSEHRKKICEFTPQDHVLVIPAWRQTTKGLRDEDKDDPVRIQDLYKQHK